MNHLRQKLYIAIFIVSLFLRLSLALVNRQANDNHMQAVNMIMATHQLPNAYDCRECFHPKLFYFTMALILQSLNITENDAQIVFTQVIDFLAGMMTLAVVWKFIEEYPSESSRVKLTAFALVALNPKLIAINSQASNDSFVILFCTLALFFTYRLIKAPSNKIFWAVVIFILLAMSTKATGWLIFIAVFFSLLLTHLVAGKEAGITPIRLSVFLISVLFFTTLNPLSQIVSNYKMFGAPITISDRSLPLPSLFEKSYPTEKYIFRPGILSIQDGFLTFKLFDLLSYPLTTNGPSDYPPFRTSFWTMLYADTHSLHFQNWPSSWQTLNQDDFAVSRGIFLLGLLPTLIFIGGFFSDILAFLRGIARRNILQFQTTCNGLFVITYGGYITFLILCALLFRDFSYVKLIYILPSLLAIVWLFLRGADMALSHYPKRVAWGIKLMDIWMVILSLLYVWDVTSMALHLYAINS